MQEVILPDVDATRKWAREFARTLKAPVTVALHGDLGMGKSEIARAIIQELRGENIVVPSPTFTIVQNYEGISHFDLYRVADASELVEVGLPYAIQNDITLIEWPDVANGMLPDNTVHIYISPCGMDCDMGRKLEIK